MADSETQDSNSVFEQAAKEIAAEAANKKTNETEAEEDPIEQQKKMLALREKSAAISDAASDVAETVINEQAGSGAVDLVNPQGIEELVNASGSAQRGEVSASTIGRMMGLVTAAEFKLLEGKLDLLSTRMNSMLVKMEKVLVMSADTPTGADMERIDVQLANIKELIQETAAAAAAASAEQKKISLQVGRYLVINNKEKV